MKKLISALLSFVLLLSVVACGPQKVQKPDKSDPPKKTYEEQKALYADIVSEYTELLTAKKNGEELTAPNTDGMSESEAAIVEAIYNVVDTCQNAEQAALCGYGYKDMDGNGTPELIFLTKSTSIMAIFTLSGDEPILLVCEHEPYSGAICFARRGRFVMSHGTTVGEKEETTYYTCRVDGERVVYDDVYGRVYDRDKMKTVERFQMVDGERVAIDEATYKMLYREYGKIVQPNANDFYAKWVAPRIYLPAADKSVGEELPVADFSSYAAIRNTYTEISDCIDGTFSTDMWYRGKYDNLFSFPDDTSFEYYIRLLRVAYGTRGVMGYDEIDLNGDGRDELVLLSEDYRIKAIFTEKDGRPMLIDAFTDVYTCWLDGQGLIHADREDYDELEYSLYEFKKSGEYNFVYSLSVDNYGRYLNRDGKTEKISFEESLKLYDEYVCYSEPFSANEYTRSVSALTYTPLVESTEDKVKAAADKTWRKYADLEKTTGNDLAHSITYVTFEKVTDVQMDMNLKYCYTWSYPDPERENYLLTDTEESSLKLTVRAEDGVFVFDGEGVKGRLEIGETRIWIIIDESTDERFAEGYHCYMENSFDIII